MTRSTFKELEPRGLGPGEASMRELPACDTPARYALRGGQLISTSDDQKDDEQAGQDRRWSALMTRAQAGDQTSYTLLLTEIVPILRRVVRAKWRNAQDCEDIVQDILLSLHSVRHTYDPARPFLPWLLTIGYRRIADQARLLRRRATHETTGEPFPETFSGVAAKTDQDASDDREQIRIALADLSPAHREGIEMVKLRGLSFEEASQATGKSVGALKVTVHRAMKALRAVMERKG